MSSTSQYEDKLFAWKFRIRDKFVPLPSNPCHEYKECLAIAVAHSVEEARSLLEHYARENGFDARWLEPGCAEVIAIDISDRAVLGWAAA
jgi:hypothetical protein